MKYRAALAAVAFTTITMMCGLGVVDEAGASSPLPGRSDRESMLIKENVSLRSQWSLMMKFCRRQKARATFELPFAMASLEAGKNF